MRKLFIILLFLGNICYSQNRNFYALSNKSGCVVSKERRAGICVDTSTAKFYDSVSTYATISSTVLKAIDTLVLDLKGYTNSGYSTQNWWDSTKILYIYVGSNSSASAFNLKNPAKFKMTWVNAPTFSAAGVKFDGSTQYGNTGFNPSSEGMAPSFVSIGTGIYTEATNDGYVDIGASSSATNLFAQGRTTFNSGSGVLYLNNVGNNPASLNNGTSKNILLGVVTNVLSNLYLTKFINNTTTSSSSTTGTITTTLNLNVFVGARNFQGSSIINYSAQGHSFDFLGNVITNPTNFTNIIYRFNNRMSR